jgi:hypothetical protein
MTELSEVQSLGIAPFWPSRTTLVKELRNYTPSTMTAAAAYNDRLDKKNKHNATSSIDYKWAGGRYQMDAIATALEGGDTWRAELARSIGYLMFADRLAYFWHGQYDILFPHMKGQLRLMDWVFMTNSMAFSFLLDWTEQAIYQGYLTYATLNCQYQLKSSYEQEHRRAHAFVLRLFADWRGDGLSHTWPSWGSDVPIYSGILERWRDPNPQVLTPWLLAACDRHTHESLGDTEENAHDFGDDRLTRTPIEILMIFRLRQLMGLTNPVVDHPLMEPPFDCLPETQPPFVPDELMQGTLKRAREDWPQFDQVTSIEAVMAKPSKPDRFR